MVHATPLDYDSIARIMSMLEPSSQSGVWGVPEQDFVGHVSGLRPFQFFEAPGTGEIYERERDFTGYEVDTPISKVYWKGKIVNISDLDKVI